MVQVMRILILFVIAISLAVTLACSGPGGTQTNTNSSNTAATLAPAKKTKATGTIVADPNPVKVCDKSGAAVTKLTWSASGTSVVEVRIGSPDGGLFANTTGAGGSKETGRWIGDGTVIYLQDAAEGNPRTAEYTIATVTVNVTNEGCP